MRGKSEKLGAMFEAKGGARAASSNSALRLLAIASMPPPVAGQSIASRILVDGLRDEGVAVDVLSLSSRLPPDRRWLRSAEVLALAGRSAARLAMADSRPDVAYLQVASSSTGMARDVVLLGLLEARGLPTVLHVHCHGYVDALRRAPRPLAGAIRRSLRRASAVVTLTESEAAALTEAVPGADVVVVPNGVEPEVARAARARGEKVPPSAEEPLRVLFLSHLLPFKGYGTVLRAACAARERGLRHRYTFAGGLPDEVNVSSTLRAEAPEPRAFVRGHGLDDMVELLGPVT